jgi:site-specific recombinase XerC
LAIARYKKQNGQSATNTYKSMLVDAYSKYVKYNKIENWERPHYSIQPKGIQPPTEERIKLLIASAKMPMSLKISISKETGLRPKEVTGETGLKVNDIHRDTKTIVARSLKGCNQRPAIPISDELLTNLTSYITSRNLKPDDLIFKGSSDTYTTHFIRFKNTIAKRLNDPTIKQIRLYDIRHYYVTKQLKRTQNAEIVRIIVGHTRLNTTQKYLHVLGNLNSGEWIVEQTQDRQRAKELSEQDFTYQFTTPDGWMQFRKPK